jgi:hypothetical protein
VVVLIRVIGCVGVSEVVSREMWVFECIDVRGEGFSGLGEGREWRGEFKGVRMRECGWGVMWLRLVVGAG